MNKFRRSALGTFQGLDIRFSHGFPAPVPFVYQPQSMCPLMMKVADRLGSQTVLKSLHIFLIFGFVPYLYIIYKTCHLTSLCEVAVHVLKKKNGVYVIFPPIG